VGKRAALVLALLVVAAVTAEAATVPRPRIVWKPIPFGAKRRAEMAAYSQRHYGFRRWRLVHPHVIVEHFTASSTFSSAYYTFYSDEPDSATHQFPNVCAHFIIDKDGTIYQLVNLKTMCRHTVGLNWTSIGIEHVGWSDGEILRNPREIGASLRLTLWLVQRFHIKLQNVIGHNESLSSPYHHELIPSFRCQTHGDWTYPDMTVYRSRLRRLARRYGINLGRLPKQRPSQC
jgi:N-acetylmuramoyl-L-alanine amidase